MRRTGPVAAGILAATVLAALTACTASQPTPGPAATSRLASPAATRPTTSSAGSLGCLETTQAPAATAAPGLPLPPADPFYRWAGPLAHEAPGTVLRTRTIAFAVGGGNEPVTAIQLLYVTTDELGCRPVSVVTVFHPAAEPVSDPTRLLSYQTSYDALGARCDPSYTLRAGTEGETDFIMGYVDSGYTVLMADYEGEDAAYGVGQLSGYQTLDAIRAAERWLGVPEAATPVGMLGYSGGAVATEFASELAPAYAPDLDIVGVAEGGLPVDLFHELAYVDTPGSSWTGQIPSYFDGLARGFGLRDLDQYFTPQGIAVADADQTQCSGSFAGLTTRQLFKPRYQNVAQIPVFARIFDELIMGRAGTPREPLLIGNGLSDATGDGVTVTGDVQQLAYHYCEREVSVDTVSGKSRSSSTSTAGSTIPRPARRSSNRLRRSWPSGSAASRPAAAAPRSARVTPSIPPPDRVDALDDDRVAAVPPRFAKSRGGDKSGRAGPGAGLAAIGTLQDGTAPDISATALSLPARTRRSV